MLQWANIMYINGLSDVRQDGWGYYIPRKRDKISIGEMKKIFLPLYIIFTLRQENLWSWASFFKKK